jgi:aspartokinase-like uncharacterized kinase
MARMKSQSVRVIKVGGSLFDFPDLVPALRRFLGQQPPSANVLITGGGPWADAVRQVDRCQELDERTAHWLCVSVMGFTARLLANLAADWKLQTDWEDLQSWTQQSDDQPDARIFDVEAFLARQEAQLPGRILPRDWSATSDSIAARVAHCLGGADLALLKSASLAPGTSIGRASAMGYVDRSFPRAVEGLERVRFVNLRDPQLEEIVWVRP